METVSIKLENEFLQDIEKAMKKHRYTTKTEFIRESMRKHLSDLEKEDLLKEVSRIRGISKRRTTDKQLHEAGEKAFEILEKKFKIR